jgi:hypothetical protein
MILSRMGLANLIRDARDREGRDTQAHYTGEPAQYLPHGKKYT